MYRRSRPRGFNAKHVKPAWFGDYLLVKDKLPLTEVARRFGLPLSELVIWSMYLNTEKTPIVTRPQQLLTTGPVYCPGRMTPYEWMVPWFETETNVSKTAVGRSKCVKYLTELGGVRCLDNVWADIYMEPPTEVTGKKTSAPDFLLNQDLIYDSHVLGVLTTAVLAEWYIHMPESSIEDAVAKMGSYRVNGVWSGLIWKQNRDPEKQIELCSTEKCKIKEVMGTYKLRH